MDGFDLHPELSRLVNNWCERRALRPLRILLPVWPPPMGLNDDMSELLAALRHLRSMCRDELPADEYETVNKAVACLQVMLHGHEPPPLSGSRPQA